MILLQSSKSGRGQVYMLVEGIECCRSRAVREGGHRIICRAARAACATPIPLIRQVGRQTC
jgi:hypothetical protein